MTSPDLIAADHDDEIDFVTLVRTLFGYKFLIGSITAACALVAVVLALVATPVYRSEVVVTEVRDPTLGDGAGLDGQLGGLASLAGINLQGGDNGQKSRAVLQSRRLVEEFIERNGLLTEIFPRAEGKPTLWRAVKKFKVSVLSIKEDTRRGTMTAAINWSDPEKAARWANDIVALANDLLRSSAIEESQRNIAYLNKQIASTDVVGLQRVMYNLIESETKTLMLANGRSEYAFAVVDPAVPPEIRLKPQRTLMVLTGIVIGLLVGSIVAFAHHALFAARGGLPRARR